ncbi:hypothetical protein KIN20_002742 [Parelaphostrongylus tenuis]|uniref:Uncharacterized protein n=1 Tax=Parelaphostrongylus tenuis TaxID=148309 RepID=A0AAD5QFK9_PARTN|nr:hypothetical protein KIN20_002742 [Parelaphostrongylus tenuis]
MTVSNAMYEYIAIEARNKGQITKKVLLAYHYILVEMHVLRGKEIRLAIIVAAHNSSSFRIQ